MAEALCENIRRRHVTAPRRQPQQPSSTLSSNRHSNDITIPLGHGASQSTALQILSPACYHDLVVAPARDGSQPCPKFTERNIDMAIYTYQPIDLEVPAVRLLRLLRGFFEDDIRCELFDGQINQSEQGVPYEALSYTWGSTAKYAEITLYGRKVHVTSNLYMALLHLRYEDEDRILWIDAICINQNDDREKTHQVQQMGRIYKEAEKVIIWLGEGTEESNRAMDLMKSLHNYTVKIGSDWRPLAKYWMITKPLYVANVSPQRSDLSQDNELTQSIQLCQGMRFYWLGHGFAGCGSCKK
jgi:hypothetical protein